MTKTSEGLPHRIEGLAKGREGPNPGFIYYVSWSSGQKALSGGVGLQGVEIEMDPPGNGNQDGTPAERCVDDTLSQQSLSVGASPYGIVNLAGNVAEWTGDWYLANHYENATEVDPVGPEEGWRVDAQNPEGFEAIVARGGSLGTGSGSLRTFHRTAEPADATSNGLGFRCVFNPK